MTSRKKTDQWERILIFSDTHSVFLDRKAWKVFLQVCEAYQPDRVIGNGDTIDCVGISEHASKLALHSPETLDDFPFDYELDFTFNEILRPLRKAVGRSCKIDLRLGNHEWRFIRPNRANAKALAEILDVCAKRGATKLEDLLKLDKIDATLSYNGVDVLYDSFVLVHGKSTSPTAAKFNLDKYGCGTSGHSHRANSFTKYARGNLQGWWESGTLRTTKNVEYLVHGDQPDWVNAFLSLTINRNTGRFFCHTHYIIGGQCEFNGQLFSA